MGERSPEYTERISMRKAILFSLMLAPLVSNLASAGSPFDQIASHSKVGFYCYGHDKDDCNIEIDRPNGSRGLFPLSEFPKLIKTESLIESTAEVPEMTFAEFLGVEPDIASDFELLLAFQSQPYRHKLSFENLRYTFEPEADETVSMKKIAKIYLYERNDNYYHKKVLSTENTASAALKRFVEKKRSGFALQCKQNSGV